MRLAGLVLASLFVAGAAQAATDADHIRNLERDLAPSATAPGLAPVSLAARMRQLHVPGVSIAYIHDGRIVWARGFGVTRIGGPPVTPDTLFQAGSISKAVTAFGALRLAAAGRIDLDADVRGYLDRWTIPENEFSRGAKITLRQLLSHTAGMTVHGFSGYARDAPVPSTVQILDGVPPANSPPITVEAAPGTSFQYSGGGYVVAQLALEDVTKTPFADLMRRNVLAPLSMTHSTFQQTLSKAQARRAATPYRGWSEPVRGGSHRYPEMAPAGLWSTPSDLARFVIAIQNSLASRSGRALSPEMARQQLAPVASPQLLGMTVAGVPNGYGLGLVTAGGGHPFFWHDGQDDGFTSMMVAYRNGDGMVVMTNGDDGGDLCGDIVRTMAEEYGWPDFQPVAAAGTGAATPDRYVGHYRTKNGRIFAITSDGGVLRERHLGDGSSRLLADGENAFVGSDWAGIAGAAHWRFTMGADGRAVSLMQRQDGNEITAVRMDDSDPASVWIDTLLKRIDSQTQDQGTQVALRDTIEQLRRDTPDFSRLEPSAADGLRHNEEFYLRDAKRLGAVGDITFKGVGLGGNDIYEVRFANGWAIWRIGLSRIGKIRAAFYETE